MTEWLIVAIRERERETERDTHTETQRHRERHTDTERVLHDGQNHLFPDDKISGLRNSLGEVCMSVDTCRDSISNFSTETEEHRQVLQDTLWFLVY